MANDTIKIDLRARQGTKKHFGLSDIHYSVEQGKNENVNVTRAIIVEKQPLYPLYTADGYDAVYNLGSTVASAFGKYLFGKSTSAAGSVGGKAISQTAKWVSNGLQNSIVSDLSKGSSQYFENSNEKYFNIIKNLFSTDTESYVASYELPFLSDYFLEADGHSGWEVNGIEAMIGQFSTIAEYINMGYPVTPNWKYESKRLQTEFEFNLINDTTENLIKNLKLIMTMLPGMMHVLINGTESLSQLSNGLKNAVKDLGGKADSILNKLTTMYKSPNVYEVIVPGRFRWVWCSLSMDVKYVGKVFNDNVGSSYNVFNGNSELIGFPEIFKITVNVESLLPQSFNEFYYFMTKNDFSSSGYVSNIGLTNDVKDYNENGDYAKMDAAMKTGNYTK